MIDSWQIDDTLAAYTTPSPCYGPKVLPPFSSWRSAADENRKALASHDFLLGPLSSGTLRQRARRRLLSLADLDPALDAPFVMTGHQSEFVHPGVWVKYFLLERLCGQAGFAGVNLWVDFDTPGRIAFSVPSREGSFRRRTVELLDPGPYTPFQFIPRPPRERWERAASSVRAALEGLPAELASHFRLYCDAVDRTWDGASDFSAFIASSRRAYDGTLHYHELAASALLEGQEFTDFFLALLSQAPRLHETYNANLRAYRLMRRIHNAVNPLPDMAVRGEARELPFWVLMEGQRFPLFAAAGGTGVTLYAKNREICTLRPLDGLGAPLPKGLSIRPRALLFTLFLRLFVCDLFLHGMGGARYDIITDGIIRDLFGVEPPVYAAASVTVLALDDCVGAGERITALRRQLREMRYNPQRFVGWLGEPVPPQFAQSRERKEKLLEAIRSLSGKSKRAANDAIDETNDVMASFLAPLGDSLRRELGALGEAAAEEKVTRFREYPFFLFAPAHLRGSVAELPLYSRVK